MKNCRVILQTEKSMCVFDLSLDSDKKEMGIFIDPKNNILEIKGKILKHFVFKGSLKYEQKEEIKPEKLVINNEQKQVLIDFCNKYLKIEVGMEPAWYLSSYGG